MMTMMLLEFIRRFKPENKKLLRKLEMTNIMRSSKCLSSWKRKN